MGEPPIAPVGAAIANAFAAATGRRIRTLPDDAGARSETRSLGAHPVDEGGAAMARYLH